MTIRMECLRAIMVEGSVLGYEASLLWVSSIARANPLVRQSCCVARVARCASLRLAINVDTSRLGLSRLSTDAKLPEMICFSSEKRKRLWKWPGIRPSDIPHTVPIGALGSYWLGICCGAHGQAALLMARPCPCGIEMA